MPASTPMSPVSRERKAASVIERPKVWWGNASATWFCVSALIAALGALATGCVSTSVMETGRALEEGENRVTSSFALGWQRDAMIAYQRPEGGDDWALNTVEGYPVAPYQMEWMTRWSWGVGAGIQADAAVIAPMPLGVGLQLGMKWEVPLNSDVFAVAANAQGGASLGGLGSSGEAGLTIVNGHVDGGLIVSVHPTDDYALYASPRVRTDGIYHNVWSEETGTAATGGGMSYGGGAGVTFDIPRQSEYFLETVILHSPQAHRDDGLRVMIGVGVRGETAGEGIMGW